MEPGPSHDLQAGARPVDGVALPLLEIYLVYSTSNYDKEISFVSDQFLGSEVSLALFALSSRQVGRKLSSWRMGIVVSPATPLVLIILLGITEVKLVTATTVAVTAPVVISEVQLGNNSLYC